MQMQCNTRHGTAMGCMDGWMDGRTYGQHTGAISPLPKHALRVHAPTANLRTEIMELRGFYPSRILISRGGILMSIRIFPEMLSQRILVGIFVVGRLGVSRHPPRRLGARAWERLQLFGQGYGYEYHSSHCPFCADAKHRLQAVLFCYTHLFYKLSVGMSQPTMHRMRFHWIKLNGTYCFAIAKGKHINC